MSVSRRRVIKILVHAQIRLSSDLNCDFSTPCRWTNGSIAGPMLPEGIGWAPRSDNSQQSQDEKFPLSDGKAENIFVYSTAPGGRYEIWLVSDIIDCQLGGARLKFWHFFTGKNAKLDVCTRFPPGSTDPTKLHCYEPLSDIRAQQWTLTSVSLPPMSQSMEIVLKASFEAPNDLIALDDITYEAILCETVRRGAAQGGGGQIDELISTNQGIAQFSQKAIFPTNLRHESNVFIPAKDFSVDSNIRASPPRSPFESSTSEILPLNSQDLTSNCGIDCSFDTNHLCNYISKDKSETIIRAWQLTNKPISNPLTGIATDSRGDGSFLYAGNAANFNHIYVLKSQANVSSSLKSDAVVQFSYYLAGVRGRILVCMLHGPTPKSPDMEVEIIKTFVENKNTSGMCPFELNGAKMQMDSRHWKRGSVTLPQGTSQLFFIADRLPKNYVIGLDEIRLMDRLGRIPAECPSNFGSGSGGVDEPIVYTTTESATIRSINVEDYFQQL
ncbi:MAM domain, meprin/A5/mu domain-containing protein [Ditylenchus destructor]|nr:MAM domain, meprin/A5/mu domain-containing protein [Ditylenchus destructor]